MTDKPAQRSRRARRALAHLPEVDPALAALAIWCSTHDQDGKDTSTSGDRVLVGKDFSHLPLQEQIGVLGHHILHVALRQEVSMQAMANRLGGRFDAEIYNLCADAIVNECLLRGGHALPRPAVLLSTLVTETLPGRTAPPQDCLAEWDLDRLYFRLAGGDAAERNRLSAYALETRFAPDIVPDKPDPSIDPAAAEWHALLIRAHNAGGAAGRGIGTALRHLAGIPLSRTPWERHLRGVLARALSHTPRQSFRRPRANWIAREAQAIRSDLPRPVFEPALMRQSHRPRIVVGIDTSGSISEDMLGLFAGEVIGITKRTGAETHVLFFDEKVHAQERLDFHAASAVFDRLRFRREGGTSFVDLIERAERLSPGIIVVLTDTIGTFGPRPGTKVLWASTAPVADPPPFGQVLELVR